MPLSTRKARLGSPIFATEMEVDEVGLEHILISVKFQPTFNSFILTHRHHPTFNSFLLAHRHRNNDHRKLHVALRTATRYMSTAHIL